MEAVVEKPWLKHYEEGVPATIDYPDTVMPKILADTARKFPDQVATIFKGGRLTYRELNELVDKFTAGLQKLGVKKGDRVAIHLPNCPQFLISYYAILRAGGIVVPCNPMYVAREMEHQLNDSGAEVIITLSAFYPLIKQIRDETKLRHVIVAKIKTYFPGLLKLLFTLLKEKKDGHVVDISGDANTYWFQDVLDSAPAKPNRRNRRDHPDHPAPIPQLRDDHLHEPRRVHRQHTTPGSQPTRPQRRVGNHQQIPSHHLPRRAGHVRGHQ